MKLTYFSVEKNLFQVTAELIELTVGDLERKISCDPKFPRFWRRYVDDVSAIVKRDKVKETLE